MKFLVLVSVDDLRKIAINPVDDFLVSEIVNGQTEHSLKGAIELVDLDNGKAFIRLVQP